MNTVVCIGTGPSLTLGQIQTARDKGFDLYGCNNVYQIVPDLKLLYSCNGEWWDEYWEQVKDHPCEKWTTNLAAAHHYGVNHINETNEFGLSKTRGVIHHGHGSGYSLLSMAHEKGYERAILLGYDMRYPADYNGQQRRIGTGKRHYFGEYPNHLQHWPSVMVKEGVHVELCEYYASVEKQGLVKVINATPESALTCFEAKDISEC